LKKNSREQNHLNPGIPGISREKIIIENNAIFRTFPKKMMYFNVDELMLKFEMAFHYRIAACTAKNLGKK